MSYYPRILFATLIVKTIFLLFFIHCGLIGLGPDEAQYWTWSRDLSLGYYSKPPGIAWQIYLGTLFFGSTEMGVRIVSVILGFLMPTLVFHLGKKSGFSEKTAFLGAFAFALSPLGFLSSFFAITDVGSVFFFTIAFIVLMDGFSKNKIDYRLAGLYIALGALFKWVSYYFWFFALATLILKKGKLKSFFQGLLISLAGLIPSLIWNIQNRFVTFLHVWYQAGSKGDLAPNAQILSIKSFFDFIGAESALVSPILFIMLIIALGALFQKNSVENRARFLGFCTLATLSIFALFSLFMKIQGNWCDFIYPMAFCFLAKVWQQRPRLVYGASLFSCILMLYLFMSPLLENSGFSPPFKSNPFKHNLGWNHLASALKEAGYQEDHDFLFAPKYQTVSLLSFYGPHQKKAYFFNLYGARLNQFSFWKGMRDERIGQNGYFAVVENAPHLDQERNKVQQTIQDLEPYFQKVSFAGEYPLYSSRGETVKAMFLFLGEGYNGKEPLATEKY